MLASALIRQVLPQGSVRRVIAGPARGMKFVVGAGIGASYWLGRAAAAPTFFSSLVGPGDTVIDVGANKGQMTLLFAALVGPTGTVVSFEPAPVEFAALQRNVALNQLRQVRLMQAAVSSEEGAGQFAYVPQHPTEGRLVNVAAPVGEFETVSVRTMPLDALVEEGVRPTLIKIDAEGAGPGVLRGAQRLIAEASPVIFIELHSAEEQIAVKEELVDRGYETYTLDGALISDPTARWINPLICKRTPDRRSGE